MTQRVMFFYLFPLSRRSVMAYLSKKITSCVFISLWHCNNDLVGNITYHRHHGKSKETHEVIFCGYHGKRYCSRARTHHDDDDDDDDGVAQHGGHNRNEAKFISVVFLWLGRSGLIAELMKFFKERT